jgi:hypothetical protein
VATATLECGSGTPACTDRTILADGTSCGSGLTCNAGTCVASRTVAATRTVTYWPDVGAEVPVAPADAAASTAAALVPDGLGGWSSYPGTVDALGAVSIPSVPAEFFWLRFQQPGGPSTYLDTAALTSVDLGYDRLGRSTAAPVTAPTAITFGVTLPAGVAWPASNADQLQVSSSNADVWDRLSPASLAVDRLSGTWVDDWFTSNAAGVALNRVLAGDSFTVYHLVSQTDPTSGRGYLAAGGRSTSGTLDITSGQPQTVTLALDTAGLASSTLASGAWSVSAFEALRPAMNLPAGSGATHSLLVGASVGTLTGNGPVPRAPPTLFTMTVPGETTPDPVLGTALTYNRVLDTALWNEWREVDFTGSVSFTTPGASGTFTETVSVGRREAMPASTPLAPTLTPVRNLIVRATTGLESSASATVTGVGLTPTLLWTAPLTGVATSYTVEVFRLGLDGSASTSTKVATFVTASPQVAIPTGVLIAGSAHYVRVTARAIASDPWANAPFRRVVLGAWAATLSGTLTP